MADCDLASKTSRSLMPRCGQSVGGEVALQHLAGCTLLERLELQVHGVWASQLWNLLMIIPIP